MPSLFIIYRNHLKNGWYIMLLVMAALPLNAQCPLFSETYGNSAYNEGIATFQLPDSTYLLVGNSAGYLSHTAPYIARLDTNGSLIYDVMISKPWQMNVTAAVYLDSFLYMTGYAYQQNDYQCMFLMTDINGTILLEKYWGTVGWDLPWDLVPLIGGTIYICGEREKMTYGGTDAFLTCLDSSGSVIWEKDFGGSGYDAFYTIDIGHSQSLIMAGVTCNLQPTGDSAMYIVHTDLAGNLIWDTTDNEPGMDFVTDIHPDIQGGYYLCGITERYPGFGVEGILMYMDYNGTILWGSQFGSENRDGLLCALQMPDFTYRMAGYTSGIFSSGKKDFYLQNADIFGNWSPLSTNQIIGGPKDEEAIHLISTLDGGFLMTGTTRSFGTGITNIYLVKTDDLGYALPYTGHQTGIAGQESLSGAAEKHHVSPNPAGSQVTICYGGSNLPVKPVVILYDMTGRIIRRFDATFHAHEGLVLSLDKIPGGMYILMIGNESHRLIIK